MTPKPKDIYIHHNGNEYEVIMLANKQSTRPEYPITVVYSGENGHIWAKTLDDFNKKMTKKD